jgi:hypothetical protein
MNRLTKLIAVILVIFVSFAALAYWFYWDETKKQPDIVSISRFDYIFSKDLKRATDMAEMPALREVSLDGDDLEVRILRAYSLSEQEGVFIKRVKGEWSGRHLRLKSNEHGDVQAAEVNELKTPASGWILFWGKLVEKGIMLLPLSPENECDTSRIDGIRYFVEISQNNTYRNYQYQQGNFECRESKQMSEIGEIIGLEFDSGQEECKMYEWFACMTNRKGQSLAAPK